MPSPTPGPGWRPVSERSPVGISWGGQEYVSYQHGAEYVPRTGMYLLHEGERVIPANINRMLPRISTPDFGRMLQLAGQTVYNTVTQHVDRSVKFLGDLHLHNLTDVSGLVRHLRMYSAGR